MILQNPLKIYLSGLFLLFLFAGCGDDSSGSNSANDDCVCESEDNCDLQCGNENTDIRDSSTENKENTEILSVTASVDYNKVTIKDEVRLDARVSDTSCTAAKYEWVCGTDSAKTQSTTMVMPSKAQEGYLCVVQVTDDKGRKAKDSVKIDVILAPPSIKVSNRNISVRKGHDIALNASAKDDNGLPSDPGSIVKREWSCASPSQITKNWKTVSDYDTVWTAPSSQAELYCVARVTDNDGNQASDTVRVSVSGNPSLKVAEESLYIVKDEGFSLDAFVNSEWSGIDWFTWECKDASTLKSLETSIVKYGYSSNGNTFKVDKDASYSTKSTKMYCIISVQESKSNEVYRDTTTVRVMAVSPVGVISAADTAYLWSGDESVDDEAIYYYTPKWGGFLSTMGELGDTKEQAFFWKFSNVDDNFYQGEKDGTLDTSTAEFNTAFIRRTREGSVTITLDYWDSTSAEPTPNFSKIHQAKAVSHKVYFAKAWRNLGKDTVIAKTVSAVAPSIAIVNNVPVVAYAESNTSVVVSRLNNGSWAKLGTITTANVKSLSAVAHGSDFYVGIIDNNGLTVYKSTNGTSHPAKAGSSISGIKDAKLISNGSGNPHAVVINANSKIVMYDYSGSAWSTNSKFGTMENGTFSSFDAAVNANGLVVVGVTSDYKLYYGLFSSSDFTSRTKTSYESEVGLAKVALNGSKAYMVYFSRNQNSYGPHIATGTLSSNSISWGTSSLIRDGIAYNVSLAVSDAGILYAAFDNRAAVSQIDVYRYENGKWHLHGENQLPYFNAVFYERNNYYLRGLYPTLALDKNGKIYLSMLAQESSTGSGKNNGPLVMKYVADNWTVR